MAVDWNQHARSVAAFSGIPDQYQKGLESYYDSAARDALTQNLPQQPNFLQRIVGQFTGQPQPQANPSFIQQIAAPPPSAIPTPNTPQFAAPPQVNPMFASQAAVTTSPEPQRADNGMIDRIIQVESAGNPNAANPRSTAVGPGQFITTTWLNTLKKHRPDIAAGRSDQELLQLRSNPELARAMTQAYAQENQQTLQTAGFENSPGNTYLAHFAGPAGATAILRADPNTPVLNVLGPQVVQANPFLANMTAGQLRQWADAKMNGQQQANQPTLPQNAQPTQMQAPGVQGPAGAMQFNEQQLRAMLASPRYAPIAMQYIQRMQQQATSDRDFQFRQQEADRQQGNFQRTQERQDAQFRATQEAGAIREIEMPDGTKQLVRVNKDNSVVPLSPQGATPNAAPNPFAPPGKLTDEQSKAGLYATRMAQSHGIINKFENINDSWAGWAGGNLANNAPAGVTNNMVSKERQQFIQAQRDFINAVLRRESGAVISEPEFANARQQYFPQPGDSQEVIAQKRQNRLTAIQGIMGAAGKQYQPPQSFMQEAQPKRQQQGVVQEGATATNPQTGQKIRFTNGQWVPAQ